MTRITQYLADLQLQNGTLGHIAARLRDLVLAGGPRVQEEFKYGGILFSAPGPFCGVFVHSAHVTLEFSHGSTLADPFGQLMGKGKFRRHIQLASEAEITSRQVESYIHAALQAAEARP